MQSASIVFGLAGVLALGAASVAGGLLVALIIMSTRAQGHMASANVRETELRGAIATLRQRERQLQALLRNSSDLIVVAAPDATVMYCAGSAGCLLGENPERSVGVRLTEFVNAREADVLLALCQTTGRATAELALVFADGSVHDCELQASGRAV